MASKRGRDDRPSDDSSGSSRPQPPKRPKSSQACSSCRKHKTRCELLDGPSSGPVRCHRCKVLNLACSFDGMEGGSLPISSTSSQSPMPLQTMPAQTHTPLPQESAHSPLCQTYGPTHHRCYSHDHTNSPKRDLTPQFLPSESSDEMKPENLVPTPNTPWGLLKVPGGHDWTAAPMLAMQDLARRPHLGEALAPNEPHVALAGILTEEQVKYLLDIFETQYSPWINLPFNSDTRGPLDTLARCAIASRHLEGVTRSLILPPLLNLMREFSPTQLFHPLPSTDAIQALLILSLWSLEGPNADISDGRLLVSSAVSMAMNLRLSQAAVYAMTLRSQKRREGRLSDLKQAELVDAVDKARLWLALTNAESMLCIGTGRLPISQRSEMDHILVDSSSVATPASARDLRLGLLGQVYDNAEAGLRIHLSSYAETDQWQKRVSEMLIKMDGLQRLIVPLSIVTEHDDFHFHMLQVYYYACRAIMLQHFLREARAVIQVHCGDTPWYLDPQHGSVAVSLGQDAIISAEAVLVTVLSRQEFNLLGTAPDNFFAMVSYAVAFLIMAKLAILENGNHLPGSSDSLFIKTIDRLSKVAYFPDHTPAKCAQLITALVATWERKVARTAIQRDNVKRTQTNNQAKSAERLPPVKQPIPDTPGASSSYSTPMSYNEMPPTPSFIPGGEASMFMNSDIFLDTDFWSSFMGNLTSEVPPDV